MTNNELAPTDRRILVRQLGRFDSTMIMVSILLERPVESFAGIALTAVGLPAYFFWKRKAHPSDPEGS